MTNPQQTQREMLRDKISKAWQKTAMDAIKSGRFMTADEELDLVMNMALAAQQAHAVPVPGEETIWALTKEAVEESQGRNTAAVSAIRKLLAYQQQRLAERGSDVGSSQ